MYLDDPDFFKNLEDQGDIDIHEAFDILSFYRGGLSEAILKLQGTLANALVQCDEQLREQFNLINQEIKKTQASIDDAMCLFNEKADAEIREMYWTGYINELRAADRLDLIAENSEASEMMAVLTAKSIQRGFPFWPYDKA